MSSVSPVSSSTSAGAAETTASRVPKQVLGQDDFLRLLSVQFQSQDPMKPMEDTAFIAQMAQFTALDQSATLAQQMTQMRAMQDLGTANSYIGRHLTIDLGDGKTVSGDVTAVDASGSAPQLVIDGESYPLSAVLRVEPGLTSAPAPADAGGA